MLNEILLASRYKLIKSLAKGAFGETYVAKDTLLPGQPKCVVKKLNPQIANEEYFQIARRLFKKEAEALHKLGHWDLIPTLYAFFEEGAEFYLVQQYIPGYPLSRELIPGILWSQANVVQLLHDVAHILKFIHSQSVIHRDIKPSNLIRREGDNKLVLVDFGAVKEVVISQTNLGSNITIGIGTKGYMPPEQLRGKPRFNSDIYALGIIGIQALTGTNPTEFIEDEQGELLWGNRGDLEPKLIEVLLKMTRYHFQERYQSAQEVIVDIEANLSEYIIAGKEQPERKKEQSPSSNDPENWDSTILNYNPQVSTVQIDNRQQKPALRRLLDWSKKNSKYLILGGTLLVATVGIPIKYTIDSHNLQRKKWLDRMVGATVYTKLEKHEYRQCLDKSNLEPIARRTVYSENQIKIIVDCQMQLARETAAKQHYFRAVTIALAAKKMSRYPLPIQQQIDSWYREIIALATAIYQEKGDLQRAKKMLDKIPVDASVKGQAIELTTQWTIGDKNNKELLAIAEKALAEKDWQRAQKSSAQILEESKSQYWQGKAKEIQKKANSEIAQQLLAEAKDATLAKDWKKARRLAGEVKKMGGDRAIVEQAEQIIEAANQNIKPNNKSVFECNGGINCSEFY